MNLVQQFLQQNLCKELNHKLLEKIQFSNSAIQVLITNLQGLRSKQSYIIIQNKIKRIQNYIELRQQLIKNLQVINESNVLYEWLVNSFVDKGFVYELIKKQQYIMQKKLIQIGKNVFLSHNFQRNHIEQAQLYKKLVRDLEVLNSDQNSSTKVLNRQKIIEIDNQLKVFEEKIKGLEQSVERFNFQVLVFIKNIYSFEERIRSQFVSEFGSSANIKINTQLQGQQSLQQIQKQSRNPSQKSHISINSNQNKNNSHSRKNIFQAQNQQTPRKYLQTPVYNKIKKPQQFDRKKRTSLNYENKRNSYIFSNNNTFSLINNSNNNRLDIDEYRNLGKTLSNFNFYRPENMDSLYATTNLGSKIRLPTNWSNNNQNSGSSISYYPVR